MKKHESSLDTVMKKSRRCERGFTIIEIIVVLIVLGILTAVVVSRGSSTAAYTLRSEVDVIKTHLRYAQARAMNTSSVWGIRFRNDNDSYYLYRYVSGQPVWKSRMIFPGENSALVDLPSGMTAVFGTSGGGKGRTVSFDSWGVPFTNAHATNKQGANWRNINVSFEGDAERIRIRKNTGFIE